MTAYSTTVTALTLVSSEQPLAADDLARACGATLDWVMQAIELGIVQAQANQKAPDAWQFHSADLQRALEARRLERDFGVELEVAALIVDLQQEVRRLKAALAARNG